MSKYLNAIRLLAKHNALDANSAEVLMNAHEEDGGPGSGNHGHAGRPGQRGGSAPGGGGGGRSKSGGGKRADYSSGGYEAMHSAGKPKLTAKGPETEEERKHREYLEKFWDYPDPASIERTRKALEKKHEYLEKARSLEKPKKSNLLKGISGPIDPKDHPEVFIGGIVPHVPRQGGIARLRVLNGERGSKVIALEYGNGEKEYWTAEEMRDMTRYLSNMELYASPQRIKQNRESLGASKLETADWCFDEKKKYRAGSIEHEAYKSMENALLNHRYVRPTAGDSARMRKERLANISSKLQPYAVKRYKKDMRNEPQITKDVCDIADNLGVQMYGLQYRTKVASDNSKGICRIQQKIEQDLAEDRAKAEAKGIQPTLTYDQCVDSMNDLVRYTQLGTEDNLVDNYEKTRKQLEDKGYKVVKVKNFYNKDPMENPYRGLTCVFESPTGTKFEFQFHTPRSLAAKEVMHPIYEEDRNYDPNDPSKSKITEAEHMRLQERMRNVSSKDKVPYPDDIEKIQDYPPKKKQ